MIFTSPFPQLTIPEQSAAQFILSHAAAFGNKPALIDGPSGRTISYAKLVGISHLLAAGLQQRGLQKGDVLALYLPNLPEFAVAFYGSQLAGGIATTVNPLYTPHELIYQLRDTRARYLLTIPPFLPNAIAAAGEAFVEEIFVLGEAEGATPFAAIFQHNSQLNPVDINPHEDVAAILYSSGTTGLPKGVMLTHYNLVANTLQSNSATSHIITANDVVLAIAPFFHAMGMSTVMNAGLTTGCTLITMPRFDLPQFLELIQKHRVTFSVVAPPIVLALAKHPLVDNYDLSSLRLVGSGAAPLGREVEEAFMNRLGTQVTQGYGMTEATAVSHLDPLLDAYDKPGSIGPAVANTDVVLVDINSGARLGPNERGELWLRGPQVMKGYLNNPEATAHTVDADGWLHTGDIAYADDDGYFYIVDRLKELIKYKGYQVAPAELEALLLSHPAVADVCVIGKPDGEAGELPKAFVVRRGAITAEALLDFVAARVAPYKKVRELEFIDAVPKSPTGKLLRRVLVERERERETAVVS
ncbi:MAG: AMP-binding protein [Anaerolineales bacterium]|nr:AMP-binding protein [Anaerolineales bacterium]